MKYAAALLVALVATLFFATPASAQTTVECVSHNRQYAECRAPLDAPQLVYQISSAPCIVNRTWGFNRRTGYVWVSEGCAGVFADPGGYHHGRANTHDEGARHYDPHGHDGGAIAGAVLGALLVGAIESGSHSTSNRHPQPYDECHGNGCLVDNPDRPRDGYDGCHGSGCLVDNPDRQSASTDLSTGGIERCADAAVERARSVGRNPRIGRIIDQYPDSDGYHVEGEVIVSGSSVGTMKFLCVWNGRRANVMLGSGL